MRQDKFSRKKIKLTKANCIKVKIPMEHPKSIEDKRETVSILFCLIELLSKYKKDPLYFIV